jgi:hypothetical protein
MAQIDISARIIGDQQLSAALARLSSHDIPKAIKAGVREAAKQGRTTLAKSIGQRYGLSAARIKQDVSDPQFLQGGEVAIIRTSRKPITAMQFKAKETRRGLTMAIFKGKRTLVKSGFIAKGLPFVRRGKERMPIRVIQGPSIHAIYTGGKWAPALQARTEVKIETVLVEQTLKRINAMGRGFGR